jgi:hypothetical protein
VHPGVYSGNATLREASMPRENVRSGHLQWAGWSVKQILSAAFSAGLLLLTNTAAAQQAAPSSTEADQILGVLGKIRVCRLSDVDREQLIDQLPARPGDTITPQLRDQTDDAIEQFNQQLYSVWIPGSQASPGKTVNLWIGFPAGALGSEGVKIPGRIRVARGEMAEPLAKSAPPRYPVAAGGQAIAGTVRLKVIVARDGSVSNAGPIEGNPLLIPAAIDAVKQWRYDLTLLNCVPVEVETEVIMTFSK